MNRTASHTGFVALFDIDGTLIEQKFPDRPHAGIRAMDHAGFLCTGIKGLAYRLDFAGATDLGIARRMLIEASREATPSAIELLLRTYADTLVEFITDNPFVAIADARAAVASTAFVGGVLGLGTGNLRETAYVKLADASIDGPFLRCPGGFGDDAEIRSELLATGVRRCDPTGQKPVVIIGDTTRDIAAALAIGAIGVGVPHGRNTAELLVESGAHLVVDKLDDTLGDRILRLLQSR